MRRTSLILAIVAWLAAGAAGQDRLTRTVPAQPGGRVAVRAEFGKIRLMTGAADKVDVEVLFTGSASADEFRDMLDDFALDVSDSGGTIRVDGRFVDGWETRSFFSALFSGGSMHCRNGRCLRYTWLRGIEYRVTVPQRFDAELETSGGSITVGDLSGQVRVRTSGGSLDIGRVEGSVDGRTSGGSITVRGARGRTFVRTSGGSIRLDEVGGDVDAETSGGSISVAGATGTVRVHTSGGSIEVGEPDGGIDASTSGGSIRVRVPDGRGFTIDAATSGGNVSTDFNVPRDRDQRNRLQASVNGGGPTLRLRTSGGSISIRRAP